MLFVIINLAVVVHGCLGLFAGVLFQEFLQFAFVGVVMAELTMILT